MAVSAAGLMMVRDEADVVEFTIRHLMTQDIDRLLVLDNLSTDGTSEMLAALALETEGWLAIYPDLDPAYFQARKMTSLADQARELGYDWAVPIDADERWIAKDGRTVGAFLRSIPPDVPVVAAGIYHYIPSGDDPSEQECPSPFDRIRWRLAEPSSLPKVACRTWPGLQIEMGNHGCSYDGLKNYLTSGGLRVDHYSWRSPEQFARKVRNGARAYAATDLPEGVGGHWRMWGDPDASDLDERAADWFRLHFHAPDPPRAPGSKDERGLIYDPAVTRA